MAFRVAEGFDNAQKGDDSEKAFIRIATALAKYHICKRAPQVAYEAMECHGGNGYIEEGIMPTLYRQAPLNAIWEGSGNVIALDVIRALQKDSTTLQSVFDEIALAKGMHNELDSLLEMLPDICKELHPTSGGGRKAINALVCGLQASLLLRHSSLQVADAFCKSRLSNLNIPRSDYGTLPESVDYKAILQDTHPTSWTRTKMESRL